MIYKAGWSVFTDIVYPDTSDRVLYFSKNDPQILEPDILSVIWDTLLNLKFLQIAQVPSVSSGIILRKTDKYNLHKLYPGNAI